MKQGTTAFEHQQILHRSRTSHTLDSQGHEMDKPTKHSLSIPAMAAPCNLRGKKHTRNE